MTPSAEIEPGPHWWKASALTTRPTLPPWRVGLIRQRAALLWVCPDIARTSSDVRLSRQCLRRSRPLGQILWMLSPLWRSPTFQRVWKWTRCWKVGEAGRALPLLICQVVRYFLDWWRAGCQDFQCALRRHLFGDHTSWQGDVVSQLLSEHRRDRQLLVVSQRLCSRWRGQKWDLHRCREGLSFWCFWRGLLRSGGNAAAAGDSLWCSWPWRPLLSGQHERSSVALWLHHGT